MEQVFIKKMSMLGYTEKVGDIFLNWETVKDELLPPDRKSGTGNGTIHVFLGKEGYRLFQSLYPEYFNNVKLTHDTASYAPRIKHIFSKTNLISSIGHVCNFYVQKQETEELLELITEVTNKLNETSDNYFISESLFKWSTGSNDLRPYFKQFDEGFQKTIRPLLLPNSAYKISLFKNDNNECAAFWLIGFDGLSSSEVDSSVIYSQNRCVCKENKLTDFILRCVEHFRDIDNLDAIIPYVSDVPKNNPIKVSKPGMFSLTGMFIETDINEIRKRNEKNSRWFENVFSLGKKEVFLSTQWSANGDYQLTLSNFEKLIKICYSDKYYYKLGDAGEHELWLVDFVANLLDNNEESNCLQQIYYGAPGTGKSYSVYAKIAKHLGIIQDEKDYDKETHEKLIDEQKCVFRTTFHPDYDYAQFVGCYKPIKQFDTEKNKVLLSYDSLVEKFKEYLNIQPINITKACTLFGYQFHDSIIKICETNHSVQELVNKAYKEGTTYSSQVFAGMAAYESSSAISSTPSQITYEFIPQVFTNAYIEAYKNPEKQVYLVIEEINRGNCAQIFGDLFQLLDRNDNGESEYAINVDEDLKNYLEKNCPTAITEGKIKLPSNFNIIATMNTSDQSLFPMDSAFKRRWDWECVPIDYNEEKSSQFVITIGTQTYLWVDFLKKVNEKIKKATLSEDKQMGNFFIKGNVDEKTFINKVMFYLWNDVCKENFNTTDNFFRRKKDETDENPIEFSFNQLFGNGYEEGEVKISVSELLIGFMTYLGVKLYKDDSKASESDSSTTAE